MASTCSGKRFVFFGAGGDMEEEDINTGDVDGDAEEDDDEAGDQEQGPGSRTSVDEDHCYAFRAGRVKAEYWPDYGITSASTFTSIQVRLRSLSAVLMSCEHY